MDYAANKERIVQIRKQCQLEKGIKKFYFVLKKTFEHKF